MATTPGNGRAHGPSPELTKLLAGMDAGQLQTLLEAFGAGQAANIPGHGAPPPRRRRRPRRKVESTYRVRVDLRDVRPPIWRRLELSSHLHLDEVHDILQTVFGWTDSHLHRFASGTSVWDPYAEVYLCPYDVEEGEDPHGVPEEDVRLDEVLSAAGDRLHYVYDYGDGWEHTVRLEAVLPRSGDQPDAVCTAGRRQGPPEDCGGVGGYEGLVAAGEIEDEPLHLDELNELLADTPEDDARGAAPPPVRSVDDLLQQLDGRVHDEVAELVRAARLDVPVLVDVDTASTMVARYTWLLERVGDDGITLTSAGYLPPREVEAAFHAFELEKEWIGKPSREVNVYPVLLIRETSQRIGLLRKHRGRLLLTKRGSALRADPVALWWRVAGALRRDDDSAEAHAGLVALLVAAAGEDPRSDRVTQVVRDVLTGLGWRLPPPPPAGVLPFDPVDDLSVWLYRLLVHLGTALTDGPHFSQAPTSGGRLLARAALTTG